jgi:hypothetical protein
VLWQWWRLVDVKLKKSQQRKQKCGGKKLEGPGVRASLISSGCTDALRRESLVAVRGGRTTHTLRTELKKT